MVNAAAYANVVPRLPGIKADLGLSNAALGTAIAAVPAGALVSGLAAGALIARWGSARVATACGLAFAVVVPAVSLAGSWLALAAAFAAFGVVDSVMDVSMNAHALRVQRAYGRSIVSAMHGLWSLGAVGGAAAGSLATGLGFGLRPHLVAAGLALGALTLLARPHLLPGPDDVERDDVGRDDLDAGASRQGDPLAAGSAGAGPAAAPLTPPPAGPPPPRPPAPPPGRSRTRPPRGARCCCGRSSAPRPASAASCSSPSRRR